MQTELQSHYYLINYSHQTQHLIICSIKITSIYMLDEKLKVRKILNAPRKNLKFQFLLHIYIRNLESFDSKYHIRKRTLYISITNN